MAETVSPQHFCVFLTCRSYRLHTNPPHALHFNIDDIEESQIVETGFCW